jgi:hypothetical protein
VFNALQNVGGGYKDGGQLIDGDFIKVENNTVSSYDNVSRDPVNFYFEVKTGEILNSVVELTTAVNATVNVYVIKNNIYYLLGNVGGNTVNAGEDYKINVTGDSYDVEPVSGGLEPSIIDVAGKKYGVKKIGNRYWTTSNLMASASDLGITGYFPIGTPSPQSTYPGYFYCVATNERYNKINNLVAPFRLPIKSDVDDLKLAVNNSSNDLLATGFPNCPNATNSSGFNSIPCGEFHYPNAIDKGVVSNICVFDPDMYGSIERSYAVGAFELKDNRGIGFNWEAGNNIYGNIRFCKDV